MMWGFNTDRFMNAVRTKRGTMPRSEVVEQIAKLHGEITTATIAEIERGFIPDVLTLLVLCDWLEIAPSEFFRHIDDDSYEDEDTDDQEAA